MARDTEALERYYIPGIHAVSDTLLCSIQVRNAGSVSVTDGYYKRPYDGRTVSNSRYGPAIQLVRYLIGPGRGESADN